MKLSQKSENIKSGQIGGTGLQMKKSRRVSVWVALAVLLSAVLVMCLGGLLWYQKSTSPRDPGAEAGLFAVEEGDTASKIATNLHAKGYIRSELAFRIALRLSGKEANIKAGQYRISAAESTQEIIARLESGDADEVRVSIIPGTTLAEIKKTLTEAGYEKEAIETALEKEYDHPLLKSKPKNASLEGYLYPDTYEVDLAQPPEILIGKMLENFQAKLEKSKLNMSSFTKVGLDFYEAVTLGSIVEKEVNVLKDRPVVAQVFLKRLEIDMPLGSDATFVYAAKQMGVAPSVNLDSPYNTRVVKGLPPGPIANMTVDALTALANPAQTEYLFFVTGDDNVTHFAKTAEEHLQNVENFCGVRCEL